MRGKSPLPRRVTFHVERVGCFGQIQLRGGYFALIADTIVVVHLATMLFITAGLPAIYMAASLDWRWTRERRWRALHLGATAFVAAESLAGVACPLTVWENALRGHQTSVGLIERWVDRILFYDFPAWVFTLAYVTFAILVVITWFVVPPGQRGRSLKADGQTGGCLR